MFILLSQFTDLNRPTDDSSRDVTYRIVVIAICSIIALIIVMGAVLAIAFCLYKVYKKQHLEKQIDQLRKELLEALKDKSLDEKKRDMYIKEIQKDLDFKRDRLESIDGLDEEDDKN